MIGARRQIPASHGQPVDARHFTIFAIVCVLVVSMLELVTADPQFLERESLIASSATAHNS